MYRVFLIARTTLLNTSPIRHLKLSSHNSSKLCWKCKTLLSSGSVICSSTDCESVQNIDGNINYFELFQIPVSFQICSSKLENIFKSLQMKLHPDKFINASIEEKTRSEKISSLLNISYQILKNPVTRAEYILSISYPDRFENESIIMDSDHMMDIFLLREKIEDCIDGDDKLSYLLVEVENELSKVFIEFDEVFKNLPNFDVLHKLYIQLKYLSTAKEKIISKMN